MKPSIKDIPKTILYCSLTISRTKGYHVGARVLKRLTKSLGITNENHSIDECYDHLTLAYKQYHQVSIDYETLRTLYRE